MLHQFLVLFFFSFRESENSEYKYKFQFMLVQFLDGYTVWACPVLPMFGKYMLAPSSESKYAACVRFEESTKRRVRVGGIIIAVALFNPEDGASIYLRNDGNIAPIHTYNQPRTVKHHASKLESWSCLTAFSLGQQAVKHHKEIRFRACCAAVSKQRYGSITAVTPLATETRFWQA